ncbi:MAG: hypothetical protein KJ971_04710 [Firmicutes bacterium]|nr:hypothetical protein [Bacillota bacterium]
MKTPKPYRIYKNNVKAFVLGCDPTGFDKNKNRLEFEYVFDIGGDGRYFAGILANLKELDLNLNDIYVQNLVTSYQEKETAKNKEWNKIANAFIEERKKEFDSIDPSKQQPVFLTSELLYKVLLNQNQKRFTAKELYETKEIVPVPSNANQLGRPLIPLYRHYAYSLKTKQEYKNHLINYLTT